jgi:radical SAM superfamily enzyme YgiQ (UPF0313 family)
VAKGRILLTTINAKWIHPSLALRLLKANLGALEGDCEILEFALRQSPEEKVRAIRSRRPRVLGISVSIWNHGATLALLGALEGEWAAAGEAPVVVLGGPELSYLPEEAEIFRHADYVIRGEAELRFRELCEALLNENEEEGPAGAGRAVGRENTPRRGPAQFINAVPADLAVIRPAYRYYEDVTRRLVYVESSRGCPFRCAFCQSAAPADFAAAPAVPGPPIPPSAFRAAAEGPPAAPSVAPRVREFPLEPFLAEMEILIRRGARNFKFLDRTFNANIPRALRIIDFFLERIEARRTGACEPGETGEEETGRAGPGEARPGEAGPGQAEPEEAGPLCVHFEMVSGIFPQALRNRLRRFPPGTLRLEIGVQTLNPQTAARIGLPGDGAAALEILGTLRRETGAIIHADLIAALPGEDFDSFGRGFDRLWLALSGPGTPESAAPGAAFEIQVGILKLLPGTPLARYHARDMSHAPGPPYEALSTPALPRPDLDRIKNFARFWELIMNRGAFPDLALCPAGRPVFWGFMELSDRLLARFGRNWGIDRRELRAAILEISENLRQNPKAGQTES